MYGWTPFLPKPAPICTPTPQRVFFTTGIVVVIVRTSVRG